MDAPTVFDSNRLSLAGKGQLPRTLILPVFLRCGML